MTGLPLLESDLLYQAAHAVPTVLIQIRSTPELIPQHAPGAGEQYRFHFDMTQCIGRHYPNT